MSFLLSLIESKGKIVVAVIAVIAVLLGIFLGVQTYRLATYKTALVVAKQNVATLKISLEAEEKKHAQTIQDFKDRNDIIERLVDQRNRLEDDYRNLQARLNAELEGIDDPLKREEIHQRVTASFQNSIKCLEHATGAPTECAN